MSQYILTEKTRYTFCSPVNSDFSTFYFYLGWKENPIDSVFYIFNELQKDKICKLLSFKVEGAELLFLRDNLKTLINDYLPRRGEFKRQIPPKFVTGSLMGQEIEFNLRNPIDEQLFHFAGIYLIIDKAINEKSFLKVIHNPGDGSVDPKTFDDFK